MDQYQERVTMVAGLVVLLGIGALCYDDFKGEEFRDQGSSTQAKQLPTESPSPPTFQPAPDPSPQSIDDDLLAYEAELRVPRNEVEERRQVVTTLRTFTLTADYACLEFDDDGNAVNVQGVFELRYEEAVEAGLDCRANALAPFHSFWETSDGTYGGDWNRPEIGTFVSSLTNWRSLEAVADYRGEADDPRLERLAQTHYGVVRDNLVAWQDATTTGSVEHDLASRVLTKLDSERSTPSQALISTYDDLITADWGEF